LFLLLSGGAGAGLRRRIRGGQRRGISDAKENKAMEND